MYGQRFIYKKKTEAKFQEKIHKDGGVKVRRYMTPQRGPVPVAI